MLLPPLLWSAGLESSYVGLRKNLRPIGLLAVVVAALILGQRSCHAGYETRLPAVLHSGGGDSQPHMSLLGCAPSPFII